MNPLKTEVMTFNQICVLMLSLYSFFAVALLGPSLGLLVFSILILFLERKLIGLAQKRLGISFLGRNGWAHLPADLIKF